MPILSTKRVFIKINSIKELNVKNYNSLKYMIVVLMKVRVNKWEKKLKKRVDFRLP